MTSSPIEELAIPYDPGQLSAKVTRGRRQLRSRVVSLIITVVVLLALYFWQRDQLQGAGFFAVYGLILLISLGWLAAVLAVLIRSRRALASMREGTAVRIDRSGVHVGELAASWTEVASLAVARPGVGRAPLLRLRLVDGRESAVRLDQIVVYPATLDSTARAFSGGRHGVDLAALDD